ncbi:spore coat U domain-containing protein [Dyella tabacisoli]|uniref:Spore coat U domain-containing protein n=1 Tax=Dyella tabacisoli TaxID=2282381 RepID=A0A369UIZ3_9GAMM|nr:spore coat U domain-containing protein [Dyella tabacisoli]RDD80516.1 spore coat U domain-containing protein [Dyella tabacisoli]
MKRLAYGLLLCFALLLGVGRAHAQSCSAVATSINFGTVSPIALSAVAATSTVTVTCTWPLVSLTPSALVCLNLGTTSPRSMVNGANSMQYDLYQDAAHSLLWGSTANGTTPISLTLAKPLVGTTVNQVVTFYGLIAANQPTVPSVANGNTVYSQNFSGALTALNDVFYLLGSPTCASLSTPASTFTFTASATVTNNCTISTTNVAFGSTGILSGTLTATGSISARCTNNDAFEISLNGGNSGNVAARSMPRQGGGGAINYQLYTDAPRSIVWGDGTAGTSMVTGTGSGNIQTINVYGAVPAQATPMPGNYSDTITATIAF